MSGSLDPSQVRLVLCDLDGTILTSEGLVHPRTLDAVARLRRRGVRFGLASGRDPAAFQHRLPAWGLDGLLDVFVGLNGGHVINYGSGIVLKQDRLPADLVHQLVRHFDGWPVSLALTEPERLVCDRDNELSRRFADLERMDFVVADLEQYVTGEVGKLYVVFDAEDADAVTRHAAGFGDPRVRSVMSWESILELQSAAWTKANGVRRLAEAEGFTLDQVVAFGDYDNDVDLLEAVGYGVAMGDASEAALAASDEQIGSNDTDAIATWLEGVFELLPDDVPVADLEAVACEVALACGRLVRDERPDRVAVADTKSSTTDVVTLMDQRSEALARELLAALRPGDGLMGEEGLSRPSSTGITWVVDPIDGTVNYLYGNAEYAVSIAAVVGDPHREGRWWPIAGAVYQPIGDELFSAHRGGGARLRHGDSETALRANPAPDLATSLVGTGFSYVPEERAWQGSVVADLLPLVRDIRRHGSAALDLCFVAAARQDAYYERNLRPWDLAAGWVIAEEAGVVVRGLRDRRPARGMTIAGTPKTAGALAEFISARTSD